MTADLEKQAAALIALANAGIPADIQELLVQGDAARGIPPGALAKALMQFLLASAPAPASGGVDAGLPGPNKQLDRVRIGEGEYVRADEAIKTVMELQRQLYDADKRLASLSPAATPVSEARGVLLTADDDRLLNKALDASTEHLYDLAKPAPSPAPEAAIKAAAEAMAKRRLELINAPIARIWPELAKAALAAKPGDEE